MPSFAASSIPAVVIDVPDELRPLLKQHFKIPEELLESESERGVFVRRAQREIPELLATEGYFSVQVRLNSVSSAGVLNLQVLPGARTTVTSLDIELRGDLSQSAAARAQQIRNVWPLQVGQPFRSEVWDRAKTELLANVAKEDYAAARMVSSAAEVDVEHSTARLHVVIDSGPRYLFGTLQVRGLERYEPLLIERHATFKAGQPYQRSLLLEFQTKLQKLPQFSSIIVNLDTARSTDGGGQAARTAPVQVQVVEAKSRKLSFGVGYSTNNGARNELNYQSYNFLNQAWTLSSAAVVEQNRQNIALAVDTPPNPLGYRLLWRASGERTNIQELVTQRDKFGVTRTRNLFGIETGVSLNWQQERRLPAGGIRETDQALVLDWHWYRRMVDDPLAPMDGSLTEIKIGSASKSFASDQDFMRSYARHQSWLAFGKNDVLSLRAEGGYTASTSRLGIPQEYLFRVGGTQTVRGFAYQSIGFSEGGAVVGGRAMSTLSAEYTHWFDNWGAAIFVDAGAAADTAPTLKWYRGQGVGARWRSPIGPLALDAARGQGEPGTRIHFAIAVAF
ncbi:MAG: autotransporter assembly complex protein TamA [Gammaproteobacteria bacterium]|nr:autotransporter assembly complex protein TamA [Gammaproteobacteria bacterium]MBU1623914.1 autotransporter assembly complex protein TamA [Gammaproteobacteria bacterium]MBU1982131.1 autotransporter assembly complex protein TamA [Gammaproteobacteria bacterium]